MGTATTQAERERITARVPARVRARLERAASLTGATVNQFLVQAAVEKAERLIERERLTVLSERDARRLVERLERAAPPTARMLRAAQRHRELTRAPDRATGPKP